MALKEHTNNKFEFHTETNDIYTGKEIIVEVPTMEPKPAPKTKEQILKIEPFAGPLFFDLETIPDFDRQGLFGLPEPEEYKPVDPKEQYDHVLKMAIPAMTDYLGSHMPSEKWLSGLQSAEKAGKQRTGVFALINKSFDRMNESENIAAGNAKKMATTPEMCRIVSMGYACGIDQPTQSITIADPMREMISVDDVSEYEILRLFWLLADKCKGPVCGYNILGFDLPVIFARSIILGVKPTRGFDMKPWSNDAVDLMLKRYPRGSGKLKELARLYGIPIPAGDTDGGAVLDLWLNGELGKIDHYVKSDVDITRSLYELFYGFFVQ